MIRERWAQAKEGKWAADLSGRAKWLLTGADRERYLNGQVTQDVRRATVERAVYACVTDVKGRICGDIYARVTADGSALLLDAEEGLRESLGARLERYLVADDAEITDVTEEWGLMFFAAGAAEGMKGPAVERFGVRGREVWFRRGERPFWEGMVLSEEELDVMRVLNRVPRYPNELNGEVFPPEAALEDRAMDYGKGCYIGQEVLSRIRTTKKMPRELVGWTVAGEDGFGIGPGTELRLPGEAGRVVGQVTSAVNHPETGARSGLGYVKLGTVPEDSELRAGEELARIQRLIAGAEF